MKRARYLTTWAAIAIAAMAISWTGTTYAAPSEGETLFREGRAAMQEKNFDVACAKFAESQKKEPAPGTALNLGECEEQRGHLVAAGEAFAIAAATFSAPDKQKYAASRAEAADRRTPRLTVRASAPVPGLVVHVGAGVIPVDSEVKMDPGEVAILAAAPGRRPKELTATLREGKNLEVDIGALEPEGAEGPAPTATLDATPSKTGLTQNLRPIGLIVGGGGAASLVVGAVTGVLALDRAGTVEDRCTPDLVCDREGLDAARSGSTLSLVSTTTIAAGSAALVGGAVLYFLAPSAAKTTGGELRMTPTASRDGAGLSIRATF